jgi:hypothetical protein
MARTTENPVPNTPARARAALEADLPLVLRGRTLDEAGWTRPDPLTILVPLVGIREDKTRDDFLLRLQFGYYRDWPASAQFVNPETGSYCYPDDVSWLPRIEGTNEIAVHANYDNRLQLVCASVTLEFYLVRHGVAERLLWDPRMQNFSATLTAIERGLRPPFYKGRQG